MFEQTATVATASTVYTDDETLADHVSRTLDSVEPNRFLGSVVHVQIDNGVVTLGGVVATQWVKDQVLHAVQNVPGVKQVCDRLWV